MRDIEYEKWFLPKGVSTPIKCGVELELLLFDSRNKEPLQRIDLVERVLNNINSNPKGKNVWKDYYPYQLEIRTNPSSNPLEIIKETRELYAITSKEFARHKIYVIPAAAICSGFVYCGMHLHISFDKDSDRSSNSYYQKSMGIYPFMLSLADHTKNFETSSFETSERLNKSRHIGLPFLDYNKFLEGNSGERKYKDIIISLPIDSSSNKSRLVKPTTIEIRLFDTPSMFSFYDFIVRYVMGVSSKIRNDNPIVKMIEEDSSEVQRQLHLTRELLIHQRYGVNKVFRMLNADVCQSVSEYLGISFPSQTQFEYREANGISADVNGYLSMAIRGGWL